MKILIPTCKLDGLSDITNQILSLNSDVQLIVSGQQVSASINRNWCLQGVSVGEVAIMLDDDIDGFYPGWIDDLLVAMDDPSVVMVSARLLTEDCRFGPTCSRCYEATPDEIEVKSNGQCVLPTAAIAFRHLGHLFDETFLGSGWEDNDWCFQYLKADPNAKFIQSNRCQLIHRNEMKSQGKWWKHNMAYFYNKWRPSRVTA